MLSGRITEQEHAHLTLLHVLKVPTDASLENAESEREMAMKRLMRLLPPETVATVRAECIVEIDAPGEHVLKVAEQ